MSVERIDRTNFDVLLMLEEITHRLNNELMAAISVVSLAAERSASDEVKAALDRVNNSLQSFARVQHALRSPDQDALIDAAGYLRPLCNEIAAAKLAPRGIELVLIEHPVKLRSVYCWLIGLIVSELISNSFRHAFSQKGDTIWVEVRRSGSLIDCRVEDNGLASASPVPGRGQRILQGLAHCLNGTIAHEFSSRGARSTLIFESDEEWAVPRRFESGAAGQPVR